MRVLNRIRILLWLLALAGAGTAYLDYNRLLEGELPVFCKTSYDETSKVETFRGLFYIAERTVKHTTRESLDLSSNVYYRFLNKTLKIHNKPPQTTYDFVLYVTPSISCPSPSRMYTELEDKTIYIDCIASIRVKQKNESESKDLKEALEENPKLIDDILYNLTFTGIESDKRTERYITTDDTFANQKLYVYRCANFDVYITRNQNKLDHYCK